MFADALRKKEKKKKRKGSVIGCRGLGWVRGNRSVARRSGDGSLVTAAAGRKRKEEEGEREGGREGGRHRVGMEWELKGWRSDGRAARVSARDYGGWNT